MRTRSLGVCLVLLSLVARPGWSESATPDLPADGRSIFDTSTVRTIYVVPTSHWNYGDAEEGNGSPFPYRFRLTPEVVKVEAKGHVDKVLETCQKNPNFYWTIEAFWMLQAWWDNTPEASRREQMIRLIRDGRITVSAPSNQYRSAFLGAEEVNRICYDAEEFHRTYGLTFNTAVMNDVPGWNWSMVQPLRKSGVKYFFAGPNMLMGGELKLAPKDTPFWWQGPDGSRVLTWVSLGGYTEGQTRVFVNPSVGRFFVGLGVVMPGVAMENTEAEKQKILKMDDAQTMDYSIGQELERLQKGGYRYDAILIMYAHDAVGPDGALGTQKYFDDWNARHKSPKIRFASPAMFFDHLVEKYGEDAFPTYSGDWAGRWESADINEPNLRALRRYVRDYTPKLEIFSSIAALAGSRPYPVRDLHELNQIVLDNDDQGMPNGAAGMISGYQMSRSHYLAALSRLSADVATSQPAITVFNPTSWQRTDAVESAARGDLLNKDVALVDAVTGKSVPYQKLPGRQIRFVAQDVPALGYKVYLVSDKSPATAPSSEVAAVDSNTIENAFYRVAVDPATGSIKSILDKQAKRELVEQNGKYQLNGLCDSPRQIWAPINPLQSHKVQVSSTAEGPTAKLVIQRGDSALSWSEITLSAGVKQIDIRNRLTTVPFDQMPGATYLAFPFALDDRQFVPQVENANAFLTSGGAGVNPTYLPGAYSGSFIASHAMDLHEADSFGITVAHRQGEIVHFGSPAVLFAKLVTRNSDTNDSGVPAPREYQFDYSITTYSGPFDPVRVKQFGENWVFPLWGDWRQGSRPGDIFSPPRGPMEKSAMSFISISEPNVMISTFKRVEHGDADEYLLRLQEIAGRESTDVSINCLFPIKQARLTDMVEEPLPNAQPLSTSPLKLRLRRRETVSVRVRLSPIQRQAH